MFLSFLLIVTCIIQYIVATTDEARPTEKSEFLWAKVRHNINTECKTCPYIDCSNQDWYSSSYQFSVGCWAKGDSIENNNIWLKTNKGCYVTEVDTIKYWRNYTEDLHECGKPHLFPLAYQNFALSQTTCRRCPHEKCEPVENYPKSGQTNFTCHANSVPNECMDYCPKSEYTHIGIGHEDEVKESLLTEWYKTSQNCYINATSIIPNQDLFSLPPCGPVPFLSSKFRGKSSEVGTTTLTTSASSSTSLSASISNSRPTASNTIPLPARPYLAKSQSSIYNPLKTSDVSLPPPYTKSSTLGTMAFTVPSLSESFSKPISETVLNTIHLPARPKIFKSTSPSPSTMKPFLHLQS